MITVPLLNVLVRKDASTIIPVSVPEYEVSVIGEIFGPENVTEYSDRGSIEVDPESEYERLCNKYGEQAVKDIYRSASGMTSIVLESAQKDQKKGKKANSVEEV